MCIMIFSPFVVRRWGFFKLNQEYNVMMEEQKIKDIKAQVLEDIRAFMRSDSEPHSHLWNIDPRLEEYVNDAVRTDIDTANVYELCGIRKVLRLMHSYRVNADRFHKALVAIEGEYKDGRHVRGGLKFSTPSGAAFVPLMPFQVWVVFGIYGFDEQLEDGTYRRLCGEAHVFIPRKSGKTEFGAAIDVAEITVLGPQNAQVLICANSKEQSKIAFKAVKQFAYQLDPKSTNKCGGKYLRVTADELSWMPGYVKTSEIRAMSAGGKRKDGLNASMVHADEHGSAAYVNGHSDMEDLFQVCVGSMGTRRESLVIHTTTAGHVNEGPYQLKLRTVEKLLLREADMPIEAQQKTAEDKWFALLCRLDPWEVTDDVAKLNRPELWRKVNRAIGVTVQPTWYAARLHDALTDTDKRKEVLTKDFNMWQTAKTKDWVKPDEIRKKQIAANIEDCTADGGWLTFVGMDFSLGNDLHAMTYLSVRTTEDGGRQFHASMDAWVTEKAYNDSPIKYLYDLWVKEGWLRVSPGEVLDPNLPVERIAELYEQGVTFGGFGYDPNKSKTPINTLSAWMVSVGVGTDELKKYVVPVRQNFATYNAPVEELDYLIKSAGALLTFSPSPMWPWEFGNTQLAISTDGMENKKPLKANNGEECKVDNVQCLCSALILFDIYDGRAN